MAKHLPQNGLSPLALLMSQIVDALPKEFCHVADDFASPRWMWIFAINFWQQCGRLAHAKPMVEQQGNGSTADRHGQIINAKFRKGFQCRRRHGNA
jgi:hypothetical protein